MELIRNRTIVHVDMDAFFASVEQRDFPEYRGRPVVVGADPKEGRGRGVVSAASYEARRYGIRSAMPISHAYRLCPGAVFVAPRYQEYSAISDEIMSILERFSPAVEPISIDEAFLDCTGTERLLGSSKDVAIKIKSAIREATGLTASVGVASCKSVAKIASDLNKPDGITICPTGFERDFLSPLPLERLWGAGPKTVQHLRAFGLTSIGDIARAPITELAAMLGTWGERLWLLANGIDERPVETTFIRKSISEEHTFEADEDRGDSIELTILRLSDKLACRVRAYNLGGRTVTLKIRLEGFETYSRSLTLGRPIHDALSVRDIARSLFLDFDRGVRRVRLIGVKLSNLVSMGTAPQLELFEDDATAESDEFKKEKIEDLLANLRENFGSRIKRASLLD